VAAYLAQSDDMRKEDLAVKLCPEWARIHFWIAIDRSNRSVVNQARSALRSGLQLDSQSWMASYARGVVEGVEKDWRAAELSLLRCLTLNPDCGAAHCLLGRALYSQGRLEHARREYRIYLAGETETKLADEARRAIVYINETLPELKL